MQEESPCVGKEGPPTLQEASEDELRLALGVARLDTIGPRGEIILISVMFDEGSKATLVWEGLIWRLGTKGSPRSFDIEGVGGVQTRVTRSYQVQIPVQTDLDEAQDVMETPCWPPVAAQWWTGCRPSEARPCWGDGCVWITLRGQGMTISFMHETRMDRLASHWDHIIGNAASSANHASCPTAHFLGAIIDRRYKLG